MGLADFLGRYQAVLAGVEEALSHLQRAEQLMRQVQTSLNRRVDGIQYALGLKGLSVSSVGSSPLQHGN